MTKKLSTRQMGLILFLSVVGQKFITLPVILYHYARNDAWFVMAIALAFDYLILRIYLWFVGKYPNVKFSQVCEAVAGKVIARLLFVVLFIYLFIKMCMIAKEVGYYFSEVLFEKINWVGFVFPSMLLYWFMLSKDLTCLGRSVEVIFPFVLLGIVFSIVTSLKNIDMLNLLPFFRTEPTNLLLAGIRSWWAFGNYVYLIVFTGEVNYSENFKKTILKYVHIAILLIIIFSLLFVSAFGNMTSSQGLAIGDMSLNSNNAIAVSKVDWLTIIIWSIKLTVQMAIMGHCLKIAFKYMVQTKNDYIAIGFITVALFIMLIATYLSIRPMIYTIISVPILIFVGIGYTLLFYLLFRYDAIKRKSKYAKVISQN